MSINKNLVRERLDLIRAQVFELSRMRGMSLEEFRQPRNSAAAESFLRRSLEAVFDIGRHIVAKAGHADLAQEYKSIARGLAETGAVSRDMAEELALMAGYRNRLVHLYYQVGAEELYRIVADRLGTLDRFVAEILAYLRAI